MLHTLKSSTPKFLTERVYRVNLNLKWGIGFLCYFLVPVVCLVVSCNKLVEIRDYESAFDALTLIYIYRK